MSKDCQYLKLYYNTLNILWWGINSVHVSFQAVYVIQWLRDFGQEHEGWVWPGSGESSRFGIVYPYLMCYKVFQDNNDQ